jgi:hemoglobin-like flavoprotein
MEQPGNTMVDRGTIDLAKASYERCCLTPDFLHAFYRTFFRNCPEAEPMFANTDLDGQTRLLRHAIGLLLLFPTHSDEEPSILARVAERHSRRDLDVDPALYDPFIDSLIETVGAHDPEFSPDVEGAWRATVASGVAYMRSKY